MTTFEETQKIFPEMDASNEKKTLFGDASVADETFPEMDASNEKKILFGDASDADDTRKDAPIRDETTRSDASCADETIPSFEDEQDLEWDNSDMPSLEDEQLLPSNLLDDDFSVIRKNPIFPRSSGRTFTQKMRIVNKRKGIRKPSQRSVLHSLMLTLGFSFLPKHIQMGIIRENKNVTTRRFTSLKKFKREQDDIPVSTLGKMINSTASMLKIDILHVSALTTSLIMLFGALITVIRKKTPFNITIAISAIVNTISTLLIMAKVDEKFLRENLPEVTTTITNNPDLIFGDKIEHPLYPNQYYMGTDPTLKAYFNQLAIEKADSRADFKLISNQYDPIFLPSMVPPSLKLTNELRKSKQWVGLPRYFIMIWWNISRGTYDTWIATTSMVSDVACNENIQQDDVPDPTTTIPEHREETPVPNKNALENWTTVEINKDAETAFNKVFNDLPPLTRSTSQIDIPGEVRKFSSLTNFTGQTSELAKVLQSSVLRVVAILMYLFECTTSSTKFTISGICKASTVAKDFDVGISDFATLWNLIRGKPTDTKVLTENIEKWVDELNKIIATPSCNWARKPYKLQQDRQTLAEFVKWYTLIDSKNKPSCNIVYQLYSNANLRVNNYLANEISTMPRQEAFCVLIQGDSGIGKTQFARRIIKDMLEHLGTDQLGAITINPRDKYWPIFCGQEIAFFDEAGTAADFSKDLLFDQLKSICSPAFCNLQAAAVEFKMNPCNFKIVIATTNTPIPEIGARVTAINDAQTWKAMCRRMIVLEAGWNDRNNRYPKPQDLDNVDSNAFDSENFTHLTLKEHKYQENGMQPGAVRSYQWLIETMKRREARLQQEHHTALRSMGFITESASSRNHLSCVFHGRLGQGKSYFVSKDLDEFKSALNMPLHHIMSFEDMVNFREDQRCIVVLDDVIRTTITPEQEDQFMNFFNSKCPDNSIILSTTNVSPGISLPLPVGLGLAFQNKFPFSNEGIIRRMGYTGWALGAQLSPLNKEIYVSNFRYWIRDSFKIVTPINFVELVVKLWYLTIPALLIILIDFRLILITISYFICVCVKLLSPTYIEIQRIDLPDMIYNAYMSYLDMRKEVKVEYVNCISKGNGYNLEIEALDSHQFMKVSGPVEAARHIFTNYGCYQAAKTDWKIYIKQEIALLMSKNKDRYYIPDLNFTCDTVIDLIKRYSQAYIDQNLTPHFFAHFDNLGTFEYKDGVLRVALTSNFISRPLPFLYSVENRLYFAIGEKSVPVDIFIKTPNVINAQYNLTYEESVDLAKFTTSMQYIRDPRVLELTVKLNHQEMKEKSMAFVKEQTDKLEKFLSTPGGKFCMLIFAILTSFAMMAILYRMFRSSEEGSEENENDEQKKKAKKAGDKKDKYSSDPEDKQKKKATKKGSPKSKYYLSDPDDSLKKETNPIPEFDIRYGHADPQPLDLQEKKQILQQLNKLKTETITTLEDMNGFATFDPWCGVALKKTERNQCFVYLSYSTDSITESRANMNLACYGLFLKGKMMVTVGHICEDAHGRNVYIAMDETNKKLFKCRKILKVTERDLSVWEVEDKSFSPLPDITQLLPARNIFKTVDIIDCLFKRYAPNKTVEMHYGSCYYTPGPEPLSLVEVMRDLGQVEFGGTTIRVSEGGDCGLPYIAVSKHPALMNKVLGIHCMGNKDEYATCTIISFIFYEDVSAWEKKISRQDQCCKFATPTLLLKYDDKPKVEGHENVWHTEHESTLTTFIEEMEFHSKTNHSFRGGIIKNSGSLMGTVEHSHTQFLPKTDVILDLGTALHVDLSKLDAKLSGRGTVKQFEIPFDKLFNHLRKNMSWIHKDFRARIHVKADVNGIKTAVVQIITVPNSAQFKRDGTNRTVCNTVYPSLLGGPIHVSEDIANILNHATKHLVNGKLGDIPFGRVEDNETVKVRGVLMHNASTIGVTKYYESPYSKLVSGVLPIEKRPVIINPETFPPEIEAQIVIDNFGRKSQLATQSIKWAHKNFGDSIELRRYSEEFIRKINAYYSGCRLLTDEEVLAGILEGPYKGMTKGMELDSSIGFTMKQLYYVQKKQDVITKDDGGNYFWKSNPASNFLQQMYQDCKDIQDSGEKYPSIFLEMLKVEKLKLAKIYTPRSFVAQDVLGVLLERRSMGMIYAKAYRDDPQCGIGTDPTKDFHKIYKKLSKFKNIWAGDYKNFDRKIPAKVLMEVFRMLASVNPKIAKQILATGKTLIERLQVAGTTIFEVLGGMASGCNGTAPINSLANDYMLFCVFAALCEEAGLDWSYLIYNTNVIRYFYGDDVIISVSDAYAHIFTRRKVSEKMKTMFGMDLDSAAKDGSDADWDTFETASWISRFFQIEKTRNICVGALKKISINASFHYVTDLSISHLGGLMAGAQEEAALWQDGYYDTINDVIKTLTQKDKRLLGFVQPRLQKSIIEELVLSSPARVYGLMEKQLGGNLFPPHKIYKETELSSCPEDTPNSIFYYDRDDTNKKANTSLFQRTTRNKKDNIRLKPEELLLENMCSNVSMLNEAWQHNKCTKPYYTYEGEQHDGTQTWICRCTVNKLPENTPLEGVGKGKSKHEAAEGAANEVLNLLGLLSTAPKADLSQQKWEKRSKKKYNPSRESELAIYIEKEYVYALEIETFIREGPFFMAQASAMFMFPWTDSGHDSKKLRGRNVFYGYGSTEEFAVDAALFAMTDELNTFTAGLCFTHYVGYKNKVEPDFDRLKFPDKVTDPKAKNHIGNTAETMDKNDNKELWKKLADDPEVDKWLKILNLQHLEKQTRKIKPLSQFNKQMMMTPSGKVPSAPLMQTDISVVSDSGLYTNTQVPTPARVYNTTAIALDNPCGTGAPFSKHVSVYNIYQRWEEKNTTINPSMMTGTEVLRISLDPATLPKKIYEYISFHEAIIPSLDLSIAIAGAAGTIGWVQVGWVADASPNKKYTLSDLQQVSSETTNMNGTQIIHIKLDDIRRAGLYRKTFDDPEPYPGIIMMVDQPVTNVQRNDSVNYPVRVQVRLTPNCVLMRPFLSPSSTPLSEDFDLGSYFYSSSDLLVGASSITNSFTTTQKYSDDGFLTGPIKILPRDIVGVEYSISPSVMIVTTADELTADALTELGVLSKTPPQSDVMPPKVLYVAIGNVNYTPTVTIDNAVLEVPKGSIYTVDLKAIFGYINYKCTIMYVQDQGAILRYELDHTILNTTINGNARQVLVLRNAGRQEATNIELFKYPSVGAAPGEEGHYYEKSVDILYLDPNHRNAVVGETFTCSFLKTPGSMTDGVIIPILNFVGTATTLTTFVNTGNTMPSTNLPTGLKELAFVRQGTTTTQGEDTPFVPLYEPSSLKATAALMAKYPDGFSATLAIDGENLGTVGFLNGKFVVRTDNFKKIKAGVSRDIKLSDISSSTDFKGLQTFNTISFANWGKSSIFLNFDFSRFDGRVDLSRFKRESMILGGIGAGMASMGQQMFQEQMLEKVLANNRAIADANNIALADRQKQAFERNLQVLGANSASAQQGFIGPDMDKNFIKWNKMMSPTHEEDKPGYTFDNEGNAQLPDLSDIKQTVTFTRGGNGKPTTKESDPLSGLLQAYKDSKTPEELDMLKSAGLNLQAGNGTVNNDTK